MYVGRMAVRMGCVCWPYGCEDGMCGYSPCHVMSDSQ